MTYQPFKKANPVWVKLLEKEKNITIGLYASVSSEKPLTLRIATSGIYRVFADGKFIFYGPARCAHNYFRVDEIPIPPNVSHIAVEALNYCINSFSYICQSGFIQAEICSDSKIIAATGDCGFTAVLLTEKVRRIQRYSYQRPFAESYRLTHDYTDWRFGIPCGNALPVQLSCTSKKELLPRRIPLNNFPYTHFNCINAYGTFTQGVIPKEYRRGRELLHIEEPENDNLGGFKQEILELHLSDIVQEFKNTDFISENKNYEGITNISAGEFEILSLCGERTGFISADIHCEQAGILYFLTDEILNKNNDVDPLRLGCCNVLRLEMQPGDYEFMSIEPFGFRYCKIAAASGSFKLTNPKICEYICPIATQNDFSQSSPKLAAVYEAARQTFVQNSTDIFMDCPTRERAGWLCDSFFTARAEHTFTNDNKIEYNFLENYLLPESFFALPKGMIPMCYPADHYDGCFIPNWGMWFLLELEDRLDRIGDREFILSFRKRAYDLLGWFSQYENKDGLLEKLPGWIFLEWSKANEFTQDINFPTNMLYFRAIKAVARIFDDNALNKKANNLKKVICNRSFNGSFFTDNEVYIDGSPVSSNECTKTCQYYAFFTGIASPDTYPQLWHVLVSEFGPDRKAYPEIYHANAFIGNYLRLLLLDRYELYEQLLSEIEVYFSYMAERTGTLWENTTESASCNHGFASYVAALIKHADKKIHKACL